MAFGAAGAFAPPSTTPYLTPHAEGWSEPQTLSDNEETGFFEEPPSLAVDGQGNAVAAWSGPLPGYGYHVVFYRHYAVGEGWGATRIFANGWSETNQPQVAVAPNGNFMVVLRSVAAGVYADAILYNASSHTWGSIENMNTGGPGEAIDRPQVAFDGAGNAFGVWIEDNGTTVDIKANRYVLGTGWGTPSFLETDTHVTSAPKLVVDSAGNAEVIWRQSDGSSTNLYANRYVVGSGWGTPQTIESDSHDVYNPVLAVDASGFVVAMWLQSNSTVGNIYANRFVPGTGWGSVPVQVSGDAGGGAGVVDVTSGPGGTFVAAWNQFNGLEYQMMVSRFAGSAWSAPVNLSAGFSFGGGVQPTVGVDAHGGAAVVWEEYMGSFPSQILVSWWSEAAGWSTPARIDSAPGPDGAQVGDFALNGASQGMALYHWSDGYMDHMWFSIYGAPDTAPPALAADLYDTSPTHNATVLVDGTTEPGAAVTVNGVALHVDGAGAFAVRVPLSAGANTISVVAVDAAGNAAQVTLSITYNDPVPGLQSQLTTTQGQLATAQSSLAVTQGQLTATQADLAAAKASLNTTQAASAAADADLQTKVSNASGSVGTAMLVGLLGLILGAAAMAMGFMMSKKKPSGMTMAPMPPSTVPTPPPPAPPGEPPKTG